MSEVNDPSLHSSRVWPWRLLAAFLIVAAAGLHLAYLVYSCPLDLAPDEAHYWDWSRHLDASYYSKGPLVAYLIRGGCLAAGAWSRERIGSEMVAVRLPAILCGSLLLVSLYVLTVQVYRRERLAAAVVGLALTLPVVAAGASLMTIDAPYTCCWGWALVLGHQAIFRQSRWAWPLAGLVVGLGILAKYTMILWIPSVGLFLLTWPQGRRMLLRGGFWIMTAVAAGCCLPILVWNVRHGWVSLHHVGGQAGLENTPGMYWTGPVIYVGVQCALLLGFWFVAWAAAMIQHRPGRQTDRGVGYLWWLSAPMFLFFAVFSLKTTEEPNWPITAYLSGMVLAAAWLAERLNAPQPGRRRLTAVGVTAACLLGISLTLLVHHSEWTGPLLLRLSGRPTSEQPLPRRRLDPTCRLRGWQVLAAAVDRLREQLRAQGEEPLLAGSSWVLPGELAFYCKGNPVVYSMGLALGDRHSQYDLWHPNPVADAASFRGKTFIFVGYRSALLEAAFENVETPQIVTHVEDGQPIAVWALMVCRGFRGFPRRPDATDPVPY
jgi:hypothetical protein